MGSPKYRSLEREAEKWVDRTTTTTTTIIALGFVSCFTTNGKKADNYSNERKYNKINALEIEEPAQNQFQNPNQNQNQKNQVGYSILED